MAALRFLISEVTSANRVKGVLLAGSIEEGDSIAIAPGGQQSTIMSVSGPHDSGATATVGAELDLEFTYSVTAHSGNILAPADDRPEYADQFEARLEWLGEHELLPGRSYELRSPGGNSEATVSRLKYRLLDDQQIAAKTLEKDGIGVANLALTRPIIYDPFNNYEATGSFQLLDKQSGQVLARGQIRHGLRRASNVHWQALDVDKQSRAAIKQQSPRIIWLTGLSGSGKSTIANLLEKKLIARGRHSYLLDGDNVRHGLNRDLGFTETDRVENIRRVAEVSRLMVDAGLIVLVSFISPYRSERDLARSLFDEGEFLEVFVDTPLEICEQRDPKGLYKKARQGDIKNFTGIDSPYEPPAGPEMTLDTVQMSVEQAADTIIDYIEN